MGSGEAQVCKCQLKPMTVSRVSTTRIPILTQDNRGGGPLATQRGYTVEPRGWSLSVPPRLGAYQVPAPNFDLYHYS